MRAIGKFCKCCKHLIINRNKNAVYCKNCVDYNTKIFAKIYWKIQKKYGKNR